MNTLEDWADDSSWMTLTIYQALIVTLLLITILTLREA
jgi:hypothetical protein